MQMNDLNVNWISCSAAGKRGQPKLFANNKAFCLSQAYSETSGIITMFYVVRGLSPYTEYEFHVIGVNNIGRGPASAPVQTTTGERGESAARQAETNSRALELCNS